MSQGPHAEIHEGGGVMQNLTTFSVVCGAIFLVYAPDAGEMPAYRAQLSDAEVAAVIDHGRTSWGNKAPVVTPDAVRALRWPYRGRISH